MYGGFWEMLPKALGEGAALVDGRRDMTQVGLCDFRAWEPYR